ncbi:MAG: flavin reductase family protein [Thermoguttaceae bacterium]
MTKEISPKKSLGALPLLYPEPALLIATYDKEGKPNVMTAAWAGICNSDPVSLMVAIQPPRWTHDAVIERKGFTVCVPSEKMVAETDFAGIVSGKKYDKFELAGFTAVKSENVDAPYIAECPVILECSLTQHFSLGSHTVAIGQIIDVKADEDCLDEAGNVPDIEKVAPIIFDFGSRSYFGVGKQIGKGWNIGKSLLPTP